MGATRPASGIFQTASSRGNQNKGSQTGVQSVLSVNLYLVYEHCIFPAQDASPPTLELAFFAARFRQLRNFPSGPTFDAYLLNTLPCKQQRPY